MSDPVKVFYVLVCRDCGNGDLPMPFGSPAERGKWAAEHTRATGHERWLVLDQPAPDTDEDGLGRDFAVLLRKRPRVSGEGG